MLGQQRVGIAWSTIAAEEVGDLAAGVPGVVVLQAPGEALEQQRRRAGRASTCSWIVRRSSGTMPSASHRDSPSMTRPAPASKT